MRIALINPPINAKKIFGKIKKISGAVHPLGLAYLAAILRKEADIKIIDAYTSNLDIDETAAKVKEINADIVGITCLTPGVPVVIRLIDKIKKVKPDTKVFLGGIHPTLMPQETLYNSKADYIIRGEGEITALELVKALKSKTDLKKINGLSFREGKKKIIHNPDREFIKDLDILPFPAWDLFPLELYSTPPHWGIKEPFFPMLTSRGCPYRCTYCSLQTTGKKRRVRSVKNVVDEIEMLVKKYNAKQVMFMDAAFPLDKKRGIEVCNEIIRRKLHNKLIWLSETRVNHVDLELLKLMRKSGCRRVAYGIESGVQQLLNNIKKGFTLNQVREAIKLTKKAKLEMIGYFMLGLPGETKELSMKTIEFAKELDLEFVKFNLTVPYPGTEMYNQAVREGALKSMDLELYTPFSSMTNFDPSYVPKGMTKQELLAIQKYALRSYYMRPRILLKRLFKIRSFKELKNDLNAFFSMVPALYKKK